MIKTVLITGGNKGIGLVLTKMFLDLEYEVIVVARDFEGFIYHDRVRTVIYDLSDVIGLEKLVKEIGNIDILINNAGVMYSIPYDAYPDEKRETMLNLNLKTPIKLIELFSKKGLKRVVNNASIAGEIGHPDIWYAVSKAGLINATKSFAKIFEGRIILNSVAPSPVETDMLETIPLARRETFLKSVISGRFAKAEEVAQTILWLATKSPEYINGTTIDINNGAYPR